jgi:hypothetical protein
MALLVCKECKKEVSSTATSCPHCGATGHASSQGGCLSGCFKAVAGLFVICILAAIFSDSEKPAPTDKPTAQARIAEIERTAARQPSAINPPPAAKPVSTPAPLPTPEPLPDLSKVAKGEWPQEVALREPVAFSSQKNGRSSQTTSLPAGTEVKVSASTADILLLTHDGLMARVKPAATDVAERIQLARRAKQKAAELTKAVAAAREDPGPEPKLSAWDGSPPYYVKDYVKSQLRDPDSLKFAETYRPQVITRDGQKVWRIIFQYRAKNGFGGYNLALGEVYIRNEAVIGFSSVQ